ncbi:MAG: hypothetical protein Q7U20_11760 [Caulobacter sp.]|nr:hypothetical protein [Caulobacter sp.]
MAKAPTTSVRPRTAPKPREPKDPLAPVTAAERGLLEAVREERAFDASNLPEAERVVRPGFFRALLCGRIANTALGLGGLDAAGLVFKDRLDLSHLRAGDAPLPQLALNDAEFEQEVSFVDAHLRALYILGSKAPGGLNLNRLQTVGNLWLDQTVCAGGLRMGCAAIGGDLSLDGAKLKGATDANGQISGPSLHADGLAVAGSMFCQSVGDSRFEAEGEMRLLGTTIGSSLELSGAGLKGPSDAKGQVSGWALKADGIAVGGDFFCGGNDEVRFEAEGGICLLGATIGGMLEISGAKLKGAIDTEGQVSSPSLSADGISVKGDMFCRRGGDVSFEAEGEVRLPGAIIGGMLEFDGAKLRGAVGKEGKVSGLSLNAEGISVVGSMFCRSDGDSRFDAEGGVSLPGAIIRGTLEFDGAKLKGATDAKGRISGPALNADGASVAGDMFCRGGKVPFEAEGQVRLRGTTVGGVLDLTEAKLRGAEDAFSGERMSVGEATVLGQGFEAQGSVVFQGAKLTDVFARGTFKSNDQALNLSDATMRRLSVAMSAASRGEVMLEGATAETLEALDPRRWGPKPTRNSGVRLDLDGFTYRRAEISNDKPDRKRTWARFLFPVSVAENVLEVLDRGFEGSTPERRHFYPQPFEQAAKVLRDMGHARAADDVAVAKREFERVCKANDQLSRCLALLHMVFFRYGYGPMRAGLWMVFFLFVGWAAYSLFQMDGGGMFAVGATSEPQGCSQAPFALALDAFLPLVDLHVEDKCRFGEGYRWRELAEGFRIAYSLVGLVFVPMVTLTFAGVLRKD